MSRHTKKRGNFFKYPHLFHGICSGIVCKPNKEAGNPSRGAPANGRVGQPATQRSGADRAAAPGTTCGRGRKNSIWEKKKNVRCGVRTHDPRRGSELKSDALDHSANLTGTAGPVARVLEEQSFRGVQPLRSPTRHTLGRSGAALLAIATSLACGRTARVPPFFAGLAAPAVGGIAQW